MLPTAATFSSPLLIIGAKFIRDIENGEILSIEQNHIQSFKPFKKYNETLEGNKKVTYLNPVETKNGYFVETGWASSNIKKITSIIYFQSKLCKNPRGKFSLSFVSN